MNNREIASCLREAADLLDQQNASSFRVTAYRRAAQSLDYLEADVGHLIEREGLEGLEALPNIGPSLALAIHEMSLTGRWAQLERLRGALDPEKAFQLIPGIGPELARRIHESLEAETLESLEIAAHDGRLEKVSGIGPRRAKVIRAILADLLSRRRPEWRPDPAVKPTAETVLDVDREYRRRAAYNTLRKIAPRRFNPDGVAWLPIMHAQRGDWHFTALFSNTARAHQFGRTRDWVVLYFHTDSGMEGQCTVVTENRGDLSGKRVIRGREEECRQLYHRQS